MEEEEHTGERRRVAMGKLSYKKRGHVGWPRGVKSSPDGTQTLVISCSELLVGKRSLIA